MKNKPQNIEDFLFDEDYNESIIRGSVKSSKKWKEYFEKNPKTIEDAEKARKIIAGLASMNDHTSEKEISDYRLNNQFEETWSKYRDTKSKTTFLKVSKIVRQIVAVAAIIVFAITSYSLIDNFILNNKSSEYFELYVPMAKQSQLTLPDGTKVWINADSKIKYSNRFNSNERKLYMSGEAFFDVAHNSKLPFEVFVNGAKIKVLGTKFNVKSYEGDQNIETVLLEGKVQLCREDSPKSGSIEMEPGEKTIFDFTTNKVVFSRQDIDADVAWKDGKVIFRNTPLADVCKDLSRHFNAEIILDKNSPQLADHPFTFTIANEPLPLVLEYLCKAAPLTYSTEYIYVDGEKGVEKTKYTISARKN